MEYNIGTKTYKCKQSAKFSTFKINLFLYF